MIRKNREVSDRNEVIDILRKCNTVRIGIQGEQYPYVVPVSFGMEVVDGNPVIYFHCAKHGMKIDLIQTSQNICLEGDIFINVEQTEHGITTRYESVIGFGKCLFSEDTEEKKKGMQLIIDHYGFSDYPLDRCMGLENLIIGKVILEKITGKRNLPGELTAKDQAVADAHWEK